MHVKYRGIVANRKQAGRPVNSETLVDFVRAEARKSNDVTYGKLALHVDKPK